MNRDDFCEALLLRMEQKTHWAWPLFTSGKVPRERLHVHLEQEYAVYVRDFPVLVARAYVQCPISAVRRELVANVYEEETGGLAAGRPHPELFLEYPRGLGMDLTRFEQIELLAGARRFREFVDHATSHMGWSVSATISTLFLEGTAYERGELDGSAPKRPETPFEQHPLVKHYGLPLSALGLAKAHRAVEGDHRKSAWNVLLSHVPEAEHARVCGALDDALVLWRAYRDDVAAACGLSRAR
jgi:pyrroloquinoline quinone (PQQ) biosynthesis protein C